MEAVPRLPMLHFELKVSPEPVHFGPSLQKYITSRYHENGDSYAGEIKELETLRQTACKVARDFTGCSTLKRYFSQLKALQSRFPMSADAEASVNFVWSDIYSGSAFSFNDVKYEEASILYNIGALHSELGALDNRHSSEGMKVSCTHFQCAAWAFQHLRDEYPQPKGTDTSYELLSFYTQVLLGQAQECILEKSIQDNRKSTIISKVSIQICEYYKQAQRILETSSRSDDEMVPIADIVSSKQFKSWKRFIDFKMSYYKAISYLYQGNQSEEQQRMGERLGYYQAASETITETAKTSKNLDQTEIKEAISFTTDVITAKLNAAKKENDFIYHEKVPSLDSLPELKGASLVKGIPFDPTDPEVAGNDIFGRLIPIEAHETSSLYSEEKAKILRGVAERVEERNQNLGVFLSSLQLEQLDIADNMVHDMLPQELVERCAALSVRPNAVSDLVAAMQALSGICTDVDADLKEIAMFVSEEEAKEKEYQDIVGKRAPSNLSLELKKEMKKYLEAHERASESNATLHKALSIHIQNLKELGTPMDQLQQSLPSLQNQKFDSSSLMEMRRLLSKVDEMKHQRTMLENQLRESIKNDDITKRVMAAGKDANVQALFEQELKKYDNQVMLIDQNLVAQENILMALTDANAKYATTRKITVEISLQRNAKIQSMLASYDAYEDLLDKTNKGSEFYKKLQGNVSKLLTRIKSVCKVQEEERLQIMGTQRLKDVNINTTNIPTSTGPKLKDYLAYGPIKKGKGIDNKDSNIPSVGMRPTPLGAELSPLPSSSCPSNMYTQYLGSTVPPSAVSSAPTTYIHPTNQTINTPQSVTSLHQGYVQHQQYKPQPQPVYRYSTPHITSVNASPQHQTPIVTTPGTVTNPTSAFQQPVSVSNQQPAHPTTYTQGYNAATSAGTGQGYPQYQGYPQQYPPSQTYSQTPKSATPQPTVSSAGYAQNYQYQQPQPNNAPSAQPQIPQNYQNNTSQATLTSTASYTANPQNYANNYQGYQHPQKNVTPQIPSSSSAYIPNSQVPQVHHNNATQRYSTPQSTQSTNTFTPSSQTPQTYPYSQQFYTQNYQSPSNYVPQNQANQYPSNQPSQNYAHQNYPASVPNSYPVSNSPQKNTYSSPQHYPLNSGQAVVPTQYTPQYGNHGYSQQPQMSQNYPVANTYSSQNYQTVPQNYPPASQPATQTSVQNYPTPAPNFPLSEPLKPEICSITASKVAKEAEPSVVTTATSLPSVEAQQSTPKSSPLRQVAEVAPTNLPSTQDFNAKVPPGNDPLPSTQETVNVLDSKILIKDDIRLQKEELERSSSPKDPYADSDTLAKFTNDVKRYEKFIEGLIKPNLMGITPLNQKWEELSVIQDKESRKLAISVARCYPIKNRNQDLMPYDQNRVEIKTLKDDYINASFVTGISETSPKYIVTQAPLPVTYADFWTMVWEQQTEIVVCLISENELKGQVYWPNVRGQVNGHGPVKLSLQSTKTKPYCVERMININHHESNISRVVIHLQLTCWPSCGLPESPIHLLQFITDIHSYHRQQRSLLRPIVMHCFGGSGRSGILGLLCGAMQDINYGRGIPDVLANVIKMSMQRKYIIYDKEQLRFCYEAVLYHARDVLLKRGILTNQTSFEGKAAAADSNRHVRHPSQDFILGSGSLATMQSKLGFEVPAADKCVEDSASKIDAPATTSELSQFSNQPVTSEVNTEQPQPCLQKSEEPPSEVGPKTELSSLLNPNTFSLDASSSKRKICKEDFSSPRKGSLQEHTDPSDPLSALDPLWSVKK